MVTFYLSFTLVEGFIQLLHDYLCGPGFFFLAQKKSFLYLGSEISVGSFGTEEDTGLHGLDTNEGRRPYFRIMYYVTEQEERISK